MQFHLQIVIRREQEHQHKNIQLILIPEEDTLRQNMMKQDILVLKKIVGHLGTVFTLFHIMLRFQNRLNRQTKQKENQFIH